MEIVSVALCSHSTSSNGLLLAADRNVYAFQLDPATAALESSLAVVASLSNKRVSAVACGAAHCAAVCDNGDLFLWGGNGEGQCGQSPTKDVAIPTPVVLQDFVHYCPIRKSLTWYVPRIRHVACGDEHTVAITSHGSLWTWGKNTAAGSPVNRGPGPKKIAMPADRRAVSVACGSHHTLAILARSLSARNAPDNCKASRGGGNVQSCSTCFQLRQECSEDEGAVVCSPDQCPLGLPLKDPLFPSVGTAEQKLDTVVSETIGKVDDAISMCAQEVAKLPDTNVVPEALGRVDDIDKAPALRKPSLATDAMSYLSTAQSSSVLTEESEPQLSQVESGQRSTVATEGVADASDSVQVEGKRLSLTDSLRHSVGLLDVQTVTSFLSRQFSTVSDTLYLGKAAAAISSPVIDRLKPSTSKSLPRSSAAATSMLLNDTKAATIASELSAMETFRFVSKINWAPATDSSSSETIQESQDLELYPLEGGEHKDGSCGRPADVSSAKPAGDYGDLGSLLPSAAYSVWESEVWSWGRGDAGQLGLGDAIDRSVPTCVSWLNERGVVKVVAGHSHSMALTVDGQALSWGANKHGQLAFGTRSSTIAGATEHAHAPVLINLPSGSLFVEDVAAGHEHSLFLATTVAREQQTVHFSGRQERSVEEVAANQRHSTSHSSPAAFVPVQQASNQNDGSRVREIFSGGVICASLIDHCVSEPMALVSEMANVEHRWLLRLNELKEVVVQPTLNKGLCSPCIRALFQSFLELTRNAALNTHRLLRLLRNRAGPDVEQALPAIYDVDRQAELYSTYSTQFCDVLAVNGFASCAKTCGVSWKQAFKALKETPSLQQLLEEPIQEMAHYEKLFACCSLQTDWVKQVAKKWRDMVSDVANSKKKAERTRAFWESSPPKLLEQLRAPQRRVVCESKSQPVALLHAGRFSSHTFVLFNDLFAHVQYSGMTSYDLMLVWVEPVVNLDGDTTAFTLTFPEDSLTLCTNAHDKADWVRALNDTIRAHLLSNTANRKIGVSFAHRAQKSSIHMNSPPLGRYASHTFTRLPGYKDATYSGTWLCGQMHGRGQLSWQDGRKYFGNFKRNLQHGYGCYTVRNADGETAYEGTFKDGKLNGLGQLRFPNGDTYDGFFRDGVRHGHGVFKQGHYPSSMATIYIGQWANDMRSGYGVTDDIGKGEKYMGMWSASERHGHCALATIDGLYYEGTYECDKMAGFGLMYHEGSWYEGEVSGPDGQFIGKGLLTLSCGDTIKGTFSGGSFSESVRVNGTYTKMAIRKMVSSTTNEPFRPASFGSLCVSAHLKWTDIFGHCREMLGLSSTKNDDALSPEACNKAWESIAVSVTHLKNRTKASSSKSKTEDIHDLNILERIPKLQEGSDSLSLSSYDAMRTYLVKAFESPFHPLGRLVDGLVDVYRVTYVGIGAHPCLLPHAVAEIFSFVERIYDIVRILFPLLPPHGDELLLSTEEAQDTATDDDVQNRSEQELTVVTANSLLLPVLLPRIYPALFTLYTLHNESNDLVYWETLLKWNKQPDLALMAFLQVDLKFWIMTKDEADDDETNSQQRMSYAREVCYTKAIDTLQRLSTKFCPQEKLEILQCAFEDINNEAQRVLGITYTWTMDDLFPVFQYVVIRARIRHLGSELQMMENLMEPKLQNGELGIMFTMLRACYFQVSNECSLTL